MRRMWWGLAWVALVAVLATGTTVLANRSDSPEDVLERIQAFTDQHRSYRYVIQVHRTKRTPAFRLSGDVDGDAYRLRQTFFGETREQIRVGRWIYEETAGGGTWQRMEVDEAATAQSTGALGEGFRAVLERMRRIGTLAFDGDDLVARYAPIDLLTTPDRARLLDGVSRAVRRTLQTEIVLRIAYGPGGRLDQLSSDSLGAAGSQTVTFRDWGADIRIEAPPAAEVDTTPDVDEEGLADFEYAPVLAPTDLPDGWELLSSDVYERDDEEEFCASATLAYGPPDADDPLAYVTLLEPDCPYEDDQPTDLDVGEQARFGPHDVVLHDADDVFIYDELPGGVAASFRAPNGWVLVGTTEGQDVLARLVASLAPYDGAAAA